MRKIKTQVINRMASKHIEGTELRNAVRRCKSLNEKGISATLGFWNKPDEKPENVLIKYLETIYSISDNNLNARIAIKSEALNFDFNILEEAVTEAQNKNVGIHFDSNSYETIEKTLKLVLHARKIYKKTGCTVPSRFKRSLSDVKLLIDNGINVRVVKGHWSDPGDTVNCRENFLKIINALSGTPVHVSVATHDHLLASEAIRYLNIAGNSFELEQLISLPLVSKNNSLQSNVPLRIYIPFGFPYLPYSIRYLKERPEIALWVMRDLFLPKTEMNNS